METLERWVGVRGLRNWSLIADHNKASRSIYSNDFVKCKMETDRRSFVQLLGECHCCERRGNNYVLMMTKWDAVNRKFHVGLENARGALKPFKCFLRSLPFEEIFSAISFQIRWIIHKLHSQCSGNSIALSLISHRAPDTIANMMAGIVCGRASVRSNFCDISHYIMRWTSRCGLHSFAKSVKFKLNQLFRWARATLVFPRFSSRP